MRCCLIIFIILIFCSIETKAAIFTVTSNADSGPGTLREALTLAAANGSTEKDFIYFNLPDVSEAGRTITLLSELPPVSSNLAIDGSTQPGLVYGISDAKVKITPNRAVYTIYTSNYVGTGALFLYNVQNVEIYGLYISGFADLINPYFNNSSTTHSAGIFCSNVTNVIIGAPGKGNVLLNNNTGIMGAPVTFSPTYQPTDHNSNIIIKSNFFMLDANGSNGDNTVIGYFYGVDLEADAVQIGGDLIGERNYFGNCEAVVNAKGNDIQIVKNYCGVDRNGNVITALGQPFLATMVLTGSNIILRNTLSNNLVLNLNTVKTFKVYGNVDVATAIYSINSIILSYCDNGEIGSEDENLKNVFRGTQLSPAIVQSYCTNISVLKNSIYCSSDAYNIDNGSQPQAIKVTVNNDAEYSGTAPANSFVYIYEDNTGCNVCSPVSFYTKTQADASGNWKITGNFTNKRWVANALLLQTSTEFTQPQIINPGNSAVIHQPTCGFNNGSIEIVQYKNILRFDWFNSTDQKVGEGARISAIGPGDYYVVGYNGNCSVRIPNPISLNNVQPQIFDTNLQIIQPSCGHGGAITGITGPSPSGTVTVSWIEKNTGQVRNGYDITDLPEGEYLLTLNDNGCKVTYGPIILHNINGINIDQSAQKITPSKCYNTTGTVTGFIVTGTGAVKYSWRNSQDQEVGINADLRNQPPGKYILKVSDDSNCGAAYSSPIEIPSGNDIVIDISSRVVTNATCDNGDGFIKNVTVMPVVAGLTYVWKNDKDVVKGNAKDLSFVQAGIYTLTVSGGSLCSPVQSAPIIIGSDNSVKLVRGTAYTQKTDFCGKNTGAITGLETPGANTFLWLNTDNNTIAGNTLDLVNVAGGNYRLTYSNATCSNYSDFTILSGAETIFTGLTATVAKSCFALQTGSISVNTDAATEQPATYRWVNDQGKDVGFSKTVVDLPAGKYKLFLTNSFNCPYLYPQEFTVGELPKLTVIPGKVTNITCGVGKGSISASVFTGGSSSYIYQWFNSSGNALPGKTQASITDLDFGSYHLHLDDGTCSPGDLYFEVKDESVTPTIPEAKDITVYGGFTATIEVTDPFDTAIYRLYDTETSRDATEVRGGKFNVSFTKSRSYFITLTYGNCESARKEVKITRVDNGIANTITPNADGVNDYWDLSAIINNPKASVNIYNRYGQPVYRSIGYPKPFDGTNNGRELPTGVYYYVIDLQNRNVVSGYITIIR